MRLNDDVISVLYARQEMAERAVSSYWRAALDKFAVDREGSLHGPTVLGLPAPTTDPVRVLAHRMLQLPFVAMGYIRYRRFRECLGFGRIVARRTDRLFTYDILRQVLSLALIREHTSLDGDGAAAMVIGDGFGVMSSLLALAAPSRKVITVNLTKSLLLDIINIRRAVPEGTVALLETASDVRAALNDPAIRFIAVQADMAAILAHAPIGLAVNIVSMQEMDADVIAAYFDILRGNPAAETVFYCANKLVKRLPDETEARFADYPWRADDTVWVDAVCPWSQWTYSRRPPFWHYRWGAGRVVWHRLSRLAKDHSVARA